MPRASAISRLGARGGAARAERARGETHTRSKTRPRVGRASVAQRGNNSASTTSSLQHHGIKRHSEGRVVYPSGLACSCKRSAAHHPDSKGGATDGDYRSHPTSCGCCFGRTFREELDSARCHTRTLRCIACESCRRNSSSSSRGAKDKTSSAVADSNACVARTLASTIACERCHGFYRSDRGTDVGATQFRQNVSPTVARTRAASADVRATVTPTENL